MLVINERLIDDFLFDSWYIKTMEYSLFSKNALLKMQKARKIFLKFAVWILIGELVLGAILILVDSWDIAVGRIQRTFLTLALVLLVSVNNFIRIEKGDKIMQAFALVGFINNLIWGIFVILLMWEIVPFTWAEEIMEASIRSGYSYPSTKYHMTGYAMTMFISAFAAVAGFCISNILSIKETIKVVKPLKIAAIVCIAYLWIFGTIAVLIELEYKNAEKLYQLAELAGSALGITALAAVIISRTNKKKVAELNDIMNGVPAQFVPKTDTELRAEIEEKVRREMIEKEIRAKIEAEKSTTDDPGAIE